MAQPAKMKKTARKGEVAVLYEDDAVVVLDKPPGLPSVPVHKHSTGQSVLSLLTEKLRRERRKPFVVHRIDRYTSGALLFAKTVRDRADLVRQFLAHTPTRQYLAVVRGEVKEQEATLVHYFRRDGFLQKQRPAGDPEATRAELRYKVERPLVDATLVRVELVTGLQNQIRVQFSAIGHPVVGDRKYHPAEASETRIDRVALHAARLEFVHPRTGNKLAIDCPPPADFRALVQALSRR
jgi:23S rRNA pseudouridine1911/1915/1917 synthase